MQEAPAAPPFPAGGAAGLPAARERWRRRVRRLAQFHEDEAVVAWWCARSRGLSDWWTAGRRRRILSVGAAAAGLVYPWKTLHDRREALHGTDALAVVLAVPLLFAFLAGCHRAARDFSRLPAGVRRRPQATLHLGFWVTVAACRLTPPGRTRDVLVVLAVMLPFLLWRCGYLLRAGQRGTVAGTSFADQLWILYPVWGGTNVPFGKGSEHLSRHEAVSAVALARSQLAGVKVLLLAGLWGLAWIALDGLMLGTAGSPGEAGPGQPAAGIPRLGLLLDGRLGVSLPLAWASVYGQLALDTLEITVHGHVYVGVLRLLGFHVFRNTYKPFLAESVVAFWNRQYFYFKELMVEFFFLPTFARRFRDRPELRPIAAVFAAACFGNVYYHVLLNEVTLIGGQPGAIWRMLEPRLVYGGLLASAIAVSMRREARRRGSPAGGSAARRALRVAITLTLVAWIRIWACGGAAAGAVRRAEFALSLLGAG